MIIDRAAYDAMIEHMKAADPREGVGLLAGPWDRADPAGGARSGPTGPCDRWVPLDNVAEHPRARYEVDPAVLVAHWESLDEVGYRPWIVVHSHTRTSAAPSETDVRYATDPTLLHLVVSLAGLNPVAVLWRLDPTMVGAARCNRVRYQVVDLGFRGNTPTDLTRGVSGA